MKFEKISKSADMEPENFAFRNTLEESEWPGWTLL